MLEPRVTNDHFHLDLRKKVVPVSRKVTSLGCRHGPSVCLNSTSNWDKCILQKKMYWNVFLMTLYCTHDCTPLLTGMLNSGAQRSHSDISGMLCYSVAFFGPEQYWAGQQWDIKLLLTSCWLFCSPFSYLSFSLFFFICLTRKPKRLTKKSCRSL